ncbi:MULTISPECIES: hypothetical protein [Bacillaceae]|uniref:NADH dehydrogenase subunit 6 n=1 Tax=Gottfriedia luciferensis TaxID=178774 RepID=A0ABX2ZQ75_9BACI|nr:MULTISPECIES: hypothetical protein [Bacillaceae]ODG91895.1 hypothetical protein BED47_05290 [Gottfriedia luciferensis]PGZ94598.1 hypothetical protein COE53_02355 [Bacillus sp. AFS029533]SFD67589.1 hypothetical protein SAMN02799633_04475 [Bacillus sp. UNCCL81]
MKTIAQKSSSKLFFIGLGIGIISLSSIFLVYLYAFFVPIVVGLILWFIFKRKAIMFGSFTSVIIGLLALIGFIVYLAMFGHFGP